MKVKKRVFILLLCLCMLLTLIPIASNEVYASTSDFTIVFSNIADSGATSTSPGTNSTVSVIGKSISPGYAMIKLSDMKYLGATTSSAGNYYYVTINGQTLTFQKNSTNWSSSTAYTIANPAGGSQNYTFSLSGASDCPAQLINTIPYIRLTTAANQAGALLINYNSSTNSTYIFHFRVSGNATALSDSNKYIVGGKWAVGWNSKGTTQLSPNFKVNEIWSKTAGVPSSDTYYQQLKIAVQSLQSEQNIRYYYNNNTSLNITSGYRCFKNNYNEGGDQRSLHMRGRAIDATSSDTVSLYNNLYNEFKGTSITPIPSGISWLSRVWGTTASLSGAYDLENMPHNGWWVHLGVKPAFGDPS